MFLFHCCKTAIAERTLLIFKLQESTATWTQRGQGSCSGCGWKYHCRYKPFHCPDCNNELGGSYIPKKKKRPLVPKCTLVVQTGEVCIYSANTSTHDDRCLVIKQDKSLMCHHNICKQKRAIHINSQNVEDFNCNHLEKIQECSTPLKTFQKLLDGLYPCDENTRASLNELAAECEETGFSVAVYVSPTMYCVFGRATANNAAGYRHVRVTDTEVKCCSKDCKSSMVRGKQQKSRRICIHIHVLLSLGICKGSENTDGPLEQVPSSSEDSGNLMPRKATIDLKMKRTLPYKIPLAIIQQAGKMDAHPSGWQWTFEPEQETCELCNGELGHSKVHPGKRGRSVLITNMHPFKTVEIYVKTCSNCSAMHQVFPYEFGK